MTKEEREVMRMALEAMNLAGGNLCETLNHSKKLQHKIGEPCPAVAKFDAAITAIEKCLANDSLEKKAENARELGLDYEPEKTVCPFCSSEWVTAEQHDRKMDRLEYQSTADKSKLEKVPAKGALLAQPEQGFTYKQMKEHAEGLQRDYDLLLAEYNLLKQDLITVADIEKIIKFKERNK